MGLSQGQTATYHPKMSIKRRTLVTLEIRCLCYWQILIAHRDTATQVIVELTDNIESKIVFLLACLVAIELKDAIPLFGPGPFTNMAY